MKGLLVKDLLLLKNQKRILILLLLVSVLFLYSAENAGFMITYCTFIASMLCVSTISYDEYHHGNQFLFTLPFLRKVYAREKYLLCIGSSCVVWFLATLISGAVTFLRPSVHTFDFSNFLLSSGVSFILLVFFLALLLPLQIRFGNEKGRLFVIIFMGAGVGICISLESILREAGIHAGDTLFEVLGFLQIHTEIAAVIALVLTALCCFISYLISVKIIEKKEF